ncbi:MAG: enoyl-CoA hydratase/isomerase family protein [Chloroflexi bacterium]|nr:enoyl-CoA hydratase/isomerase family protein [Chloroflexota bacterium]
MAEYESVILTKEGGIATLTLNRPRRLNAVFGGLAEDVHHALDEIEADLDNRVIVLTGAGKGFCAGGDIDWMNSLRTRDMAFRRRFIRRLDSFVLRLITTEKPVIGAINGVAVGAGCQFALACDIRIASENASFGEFFVRRALPMEQLGALVLPRAVGYSKAIELAFTGDLVDAKEALRIGLVSQVVPQDQLMPTVYALARRLAAGPPMANAVTKTMVRQYMYGDPAALLEYELNGSAMASKWEDHEEAMKAYGEKREPVYKGR